MNNQEVTVAMTGASGAAYGLRLLEMLREIGGVRTHLAVSPAGWLTIEQETGRGRKAVEALADEVHGVREVGACIASGSYPINAMIIAPCSMKTLAAIAQGYGDNLITRAADVMLKERRRLVLAVRETPLNLAHLRNMAAVTEMGGIIFPPVPAFYLRPESIDALIDHSCARMLDLIGVTHRFAPRWTGMAVQTKGDSE
jgi:4-hydroxy-3-polyprenylbenzoate decarboxylase